MNRHELDAVSLTAGVLFATIAVVSLLGRADIVDVQAKWLWPLVLIGLGLAGLMAALRPDRPDPAVAQPVAPVEPDPVVTEAVSPSDAEGPDRS